MVKSAARGGCDGRLSQPEQSQRVTNGFLILNSSQLIPRRTREEHLSDSFVNTIDSKASIARSSRNIVVCGSMLNLLSWQFMTHWRLFVSVSVWTSKRACLLTRPNGLEDEEAREPRIEIV